MNKVTIFSTIAMFTIVVGIIASGQFVEADKPTQEVVVTNDNTNPIPITGSRSSNPACPAENVQHWTQISFEISQTVDHDTLPDLEPSTDVQRVLRRANTFEVKILQDIEVDIFANQMVADRLTELGYFNGSNIGQPFDVKGFFNIDVEYSTICAEN